MVSVFAFGISFLAFCSRACICYGFLFEVFLFHFGYKITCGPRFDPNHSDTQSILTDFNALHPNLHFTTETERDNTINYLDIFIHKTPHELKTSVYRKPIFTDSIIPYNSKQLTQHKHAAVRFLYNRLKLCGLQEQEYK